MFAPRAVQQHAREQSPARTRQTATAPMHGLTPTEPVRGSAPFLQRYLGNSYLQSRVTGSETPPKSAVPSVVYDVVHTPGQPLDPTIRTDMESCFDADFSQVRVHTDTRAAESAQAVGALAYTTGSDIVFGAGAYRPGTPQGRHRLAHELAHTLQQPRALGKQSTPLEVSHPGDPAEREADRAATSVMEGSSIPAMSRVAPMIQRQPLPQGAQKSQIEGMPLPKPMTRVVRDNGNDVVMVQGIEVARISPAGNEPLQRLGEASSAWERLTPGTEYVRKGNSVSLRYIVSLHYQNNGVKYEPNQKGKATLEDRLPSAEVDVRVGVKPPPPAAASAPALSNLTPPMLGAAVLDDSTSRTPSRSPLLGPSMKQIQAKLGIEQPEVSMEEQLRQELEKQLRKGRPLTEPMRVQFLNPGEHATEFQKTLHQINIIGQPLPPPSFEQGIPQVLKKQSAKVPLEIRAAQLAQHTGIDQKAALAELRVQEEASRREQEAITQQTLLYGLASQTEEDRQIPDPEMLISQHTKGLALDKEGLAHKLLRQAVQGNTAYVEKVFESLDWTDQDDVAVEFLKQANTPVLQKIRETAEGRRLILRVFNELSEGAKGADEEALGQWITERVMKKMTPEEFAEAKKRALVFPFKLPGFTVFDDTNLTAEIKPNGKIHVRIAQRAYRKGLPLESFLGGLDLNEDDLVGIKDYEQGRTYYVPALFLLQLANETDSATRQKMIETAGLAVSFGTAAFATGAGSVPQAFRVVSGGAQLGSRAGKVLKVLDYAATVADLSSSVIKEHQGYFIEQYGDTGRDILAVVDKISTASQIYGFARLASALPHLKTELRGAYDRWRTIRQMKKELSATDQAIEKQLESLVNRIESLPENALPDPSGKAGGKAAGEPQVLEVGPAPVPADAPPRLSIPARAAAEAPSGAAVSRKAPSVPEASVSGVKPSEVLPAAVETSTAIPYKETPRGKRLTIFRGTVEEWRTLRSKNTHDFGLGTYYSTDIHIGREYAVQSRLDALKEMVKSRAAAGTPVAKLPSAPPGLLLELELDPAKVKVFDFYFDAEMRADWENFLKSHARRDLGRGVVIELPGPKDLMAGRGSAEMYNDFFNKWTERLKAQRGIDINEYQVIIGPEYRTKGSQLVIRDPKMVAELDQAARIREIATDMPDPLNRPAEILEMWGKPPAPATLGRPTPSAPPASKPLSAPQPAAGAKPLSALQPPPKQPTPGPNGVQPGPAQSSGPFTTLSTSQGSAVFSDTDMTMIKISEHPNLPGIRAGLEKRGAVLVEDRAMTAAATADVGYVEVTGPDGTSFTRAVVRYNPDSAVLQDLWHEMDHLLDFQSGKISPTYTIVAEDATHFRELQAKSPEDLMTVGRAVAPKISEMSVVNLSEVQARRFVAEMRNHLRDIEELPEAHGSGYVENAQKAVKGFREILKNMVKTGKVRGARVLEAAERQALKDFIRKYVTENFPDLPAAYNRAFPRQEFWDFLQEEASTLATPGPRPRPASPVGEAGQVAAATRPPAASLTRSRQPSATPARTSAVAAPRLVAEPPQPVNPTSVTLGKQLSHGGDIGALGAREPGTYGVFEANMPDGTPVAVKVYPDTAEFKDMFPLEVQAAQAASKTSIGPRFYGEVQVGPGRRAFAMERIEGNFPAAEPSIGLATEAQEMEAMITQGRISDKTLEDVKTFGEELLSAGHYYTGEVQGLIDTAGRFRPIDFQGVRKLSLNPVEQAEQIATHWRRVQVQIDYLKQLRDELRKK